MDRRRSLTLAAAAAAVLTAATAAVTTLRAADDGRTPSAAAAADRGIEPAISRPSDESKLTFAAPGLVADVLVHEGDAVKAGQLLMRQKDNQQVDAVHKAESQAKSTAEIDYEKQDVAFKTTQYQRKQNLYDEPGHPIALSEVEEAQQAVELSKAQVLVAQEHHDEAGFDYQEQQDKLAEMQMTAKFDGTVQKINAHPGEMCDPQNRDGAIVVVKNDPLYVEMNIAADRAERLAMGQELQVRLKAAAGEQPNPWQAAKITFFPPHADAASGTELVRLTLPNPNGQRSGLAYEVRLPANVAAVPAGGAPAPVLAPPPLPVSLGN